VVRSGTVLEYFPQLLSAFINFELSLQQLGNYQSIVVFYFLQFLRQERDHFVVELLNLSVL
jgi:hypothetical protein